MNHDHKRLQQMITPTIDERRQKLKELGEEWVDKPVSFNRTNKLPSPM